MERFHRGENESGSPMAEPVGEAETAAFAVSERESSECAWGFQAARMNRPPSAAGTERMKAEDRLAGSLTMGIQGANRVVNHQPTSERLAQVGFDFGAVRASPWDRNHHFELRWRGAEDRVVGGRGVLAVVPGAELWIDAIRGGGG